MSQVEVKAQRINKYWAKIPETQETACVKAQRQDKALRVWGTESRVAEASTSIRVITQGKDDEICIALIRKGLAICSKIQRLCQRAVKNTDVQNSLMDSVGEGEGGKIWENGIETCKYHV